MTPEELLALDTWGRLDLVDEVVRLRAEVAAEKHDHEMTREHHDASLRAILADLGAEADPEDAEATRAKWVSMEASKLRTERDALRAEVERLASRQRAGQRIFNAVHAIDPAFADSVRGASVDPFHDDARCETFLYEWVMRMKDRRDGGEPIIPDPPCAGCGQGIACQEGCCATTGADKKLRHNECLEVSRG